MNTKKYTEANRKAWNQVMPYHKKAMDKKWDTMYAYPNFVYQKNPELGELEKIGFKGKNIAHLSCNNGIELMSLKRLGANYCVGFDISDNAIDEAKKRAAKFKIDCEFIRTDVLEISEKFHGKFNLVYITIGALSWIPDKKNILKKHPTCLLMVVNSSFMNIIHLEVFFLMMMNLMENLRLFINTSIKKFGKNSVELIITEELVTNHLLLMNFLIHLENFLH
ncbi:MAG: class I SAM-dependent methyltransferase [Candidatus Cloacimonetes bacterium]|jgi:2-polyprenyl-3-methyl-5-hydroxy-6-metoxy-1,4-benzoquinol methylase|nr:class I SAM-dependent methyltransferase [Candidatus Cloacimonadota bacterium]MBT4333113.1 class I SAM-dependent methyltransferase [Candidatus Cloacimonadota bacterium]MBT4576646.1 class I SAM-dependent methyltransferase [Candidatus Cloacimonadota bacterium]MBT5419991.1 class I SAM-dependent methyltransferase [Candidatus Cloacimonadota bacterium]